MRAEKGSFYQVSAVPGGNVGVEDTGHKTWERESLKGPCYFGKSSHWVEGGPRRAGRHLL